MQVTQHQPPGSTARTCLQQHRQRATSEGLVLSVGQKVLHQSHELFQVQPDVRALLLLLLQCCCVVCLTTCSSMHWSVIMRVHTLTHIRCKYVGVHTLTYIRCGYVGVTICHRTPNI